MNIYPEDHNLPFKLTDIDIYIALDSRGDTVVMDMTNKGKDNTRYIRLTPVRAMYLGQMLVTAAQKIIHSSEEEDE